MDEFLLKNNIQDKYIVSCDCETNGLNYSYTRPFNLAFNIYKGNKLIESKDLYIKYKDYKIDEDLARKVHYNKEVIEKQGISPKEAFGLLKKYTDDKNYIYVGSNYLGYDCMIIKNSAQEVGIDIGYNYINRVYDTNALFKAFKLNIKPDNDNLLAFQMRMNGLKIKGLKSRLGVVCEYFGIEFNDEDAHLALYDCQKSYQCFMELIEKVEIK